LNKGMKVSIGIPTVKTEQAIAGLIAEIQNTVHYGLDLIVVSGVRSVAINRNIILDRAEGDYVIMCDDDTEQYPVHWDKGLIDALEATGATIVGARLMNPNGSLHAVNYGNYDLSKDYIQTRTMITACCAFRSTKLRYDENFIGWGWEDTDFCRQLGGTSFVVNTVKVVHRNEHKNPIGSKHQENLNHAYYNRKWA